MESAAANHIVVEFLIFIKLKLYNFGGNDILLECERERLIMDIMLNRLFIYLPYLQQELGQDDYQGKLDYLQHTMAQFHILVSQMLSISEIGGAPVVLTDDPQLAFYCVSQQIPCCIVLDSGSRDASLPSGVYCVESLEDIDGEYLERIYRRTKGIPWNIVETEHLLIREIIPEDVPRLYELYSDDSITKYMDNLYSDPEQELSYTRDYIQNIYGFYGYGMWIITLKDTGVVIGRAGLEYKEGYDGLELGFMLGAEYQHHGYAYEACSTILEYGREWLGQDAFRAIVHKENLPSRHLCERLGFQLSGSFAEVEKDFVEYKLG